MARGIDPLSLLVQWGPYIVGGYYGYIKLTNTPSILGPNDPILKIINDLEKVLYPPPPANPCPTGYHLANGVCVIDTTSCPTGQHLSNGVCVPDTNPPPTTCNAGYHLSNGVCVPDTPGGCTTFTPAATGAPIRNITLATPVNNASVLAGTIITAGGTIPTGLSLSMISARLVTADGLTDIIPWVDRTNPVAGPWGIQLAIPSTLASGSYTVEARALGTDCTAYWPYATINVTSTAPPPTTCPAGQHLSNGVCVPDSTPTGTCATYVSSAVTAPIRSVTLLSPVNNSNITAGNTMNVGGTIPAGVAPSSISARLVTQDGLVDIIPWQIRNAPVSGPWNIAIPVPAALTPGVYLVEARILDDATCSGYWPFAYINVQGTTTPPPPTCQTGYHLENGVCVADVMTCPTGQHLSNGVCVADAPTTCPTGYHLSNGVCVQDAPPPPTGDTTKPVINITAPTEGQALANSIVTVTGTASDIGSGIANVAVREANNNIPWALATLGSGGSWSFTMDLFAANPNGPYLIEARAQDGAGNFAWAEVNVTVAVAPPPSNCPAGQKFSNNTCESIVTTFDAGGSVIDDVFAPGQTMRVTASGFPVAETVELRLRIDEGAQSGVVINATANSSGVAVGILQVPSGTTPTSNAYVKATGLSNGLVGRHSIDITATGAYARALAARAMRIGAMPYRKRIAPYERMMIAGLR